MARNTGVATRPLTALRRLADEDPDAARREVRQALVASAGDTVVASRALDVSRTQLWRVLDMLGIRGEVAEIGRAMKGRYRIPPGAA